MNGFAAWVGRDVVSVSGPEAITYLQGQLSQDVAAVPPGAAALSFLLEPQGRLVALLRLTRVADDEVRLDGDSGTGEATTDRLRRYLLRTKATIASSAVRSLVVRDVDDRHERPDAAVRPAWPGVTGYDVLDPPSAFSPPVPLVPEDEYDSWRIVAGIPLAGVDLDERTVPAELGIVADAASFSKGCYVGQELVARMDARQASPPRSLRRLRSATAGAVPPRDAGLELDGRVVGRLGSVVRSGDGWAGLALVGRAANDASTVAVRWEGGSTEAQLA